MQMGIIEIITIKYLTKLVMDYVIVMSFSLYLPNDNYTDRSCVMAKHEIITKYVLRIT
jgi:hypothetical protein